MSYLQSPITLTALFLFVLSCPEATAQETPSSIPPRVELSTDKQVYRLFEPLVLNVSVTNVSDQPQRYHTLRPLGVVLRFRFTDPGGERISMYPHPAEAVEVPGPNTMTAPGETVARSFLLTDLFPVTARSGKYTLEASVTLDGGIEPRSSDHGSTEYMVVAPANTDVVRDVIEPFGAALAAVQGGSVLTLETVEALERVLSDPDPAVAYLAEPALYYLALLDARLPRQVQVLIRDDQKIDLSERRPATRAVEEFERFLQLYPNSSFAAKAMEGLRRARSRLRRMDEHHRR